MTGAVEECLEPVANKDTIATSGHGCDQTASDEGSESSVMIADNVGEPPVAAGSTLQSTRRRRSWFGIESRRATTTENDDHGTSTPVTQRRRSLFALPTSASAAAAAAASACFLHDNDETDELDEPKKPSSLRKTSSSTPTSAKTSSPGDHIDDVASASERSESTCSSRPPPAARRRSVLGSSTSSSTAAQNLDEAFGRTHPPRPGKDCNQSVSSDPNNKTRRRIHHSVEPPPLDKKRGLDRAKSMDSPMTKAKGKIVKNGGGGGLWSSDHGESKFRGRKKDGTSPCPRDALELLVSPGTPKTPLSFRRLSLGSLLSALSSTPDPEGTPGGRRRRSHSGGAVAAAAAAAAAASPANSTKKLVLPFAPPITGRARSNSTGTIESNDVCITNPFELVNKARVKRHLHEYTRNMLMDTLAKQVAIELAASNGSRCTPTSYHGNVGQGESIESIHKTMMKQKGRTARSNLLAPHFNEIGIGMARSKEGLIYLCQLFK